MSTEYEILESNIPFAQSIIWDLNRTYYEEAGLSAWSDGVVPHNMTSNAFVGKTYASLILGFLRDIANGGQLQEKVFLIELGSGHGRLAFHVLKQLDHLLELEKEPLPPFCYILTDIIESNLSFFELHPQLQPYLERGRLDVAYFDGTSSLEIHLRKSNVHITTQSVTTPFIAIANYFFDSLPNDLYHIKDQSISPCNITVESYQDRKKESSASFLKYLKGTVSIDVPKSPLSADPFINQLLQEYSTEIKDSFVLMPQVAIKCLAALKNLSKSGIILLVIDKGYTNIRDLDGRQEPEIIRHGSISLYVNFHALGRYCDTQQGKTLFAVSADSSLQMGCLLIVEHPELYSETIKAYDQHIVDFGPDDYNHMKKTLYRLVKDLSLRELMTTIKMGFYDSTLFLQLMPFIKKKLSTISVEDRGILAATLLKVDHSFFDIKEPINASFEIAGIFYDLSYYQEALNIFVQIAKDHGQEADIYYNIILCYYQLREDALFTSTLLKAKTTFPNFAKYTYLDTLDLKAV